MCTTSQRSTRAGRTSGRTSSTTTRREEESRTRYSINTGQPGGGIDLLSVKLRSGEWPPSASILGWHPPLGGSIQYFRSSICTTPFTQEHGYAQNGILVFSRHTAYSTYFSYISKLRYIVVTWQKNCLIREWHPVSSEIKYHYIAFQVLTDSPFK